jgi:diacylglycerol O-acyltransferase
VTTTSDAERWAEAAAWARRPALDEVETVLWRSEQHPGVSSTSCVLMMLDREPDWERFVAAHEWGTRLVTRLRQRLVEPAVPTTTPHWVTDEDFELDRHLRRQTLGGDGTQAEVLALAQGFATVPFDRDRPLWEAVLVEGLAGGGAAYLLKIHHALADGLGTVQLLSLLQSSKRKHTPDKPVAPPQPVPSETDPVELAGEGVVEELTATPARLVDLARLGVRAARHPRSALGGALRYGASVRRLVATLPAPPSPLLADRDGSPWTFLTLDAPLEELRAAGHAAGGSLEDAFTAAVLGGLGDYHERMEAPVEALPVAIRVSLDRADDPMGGNRFAGAMIPGPVGISDPGDRIAAVRGEVLSLHTERALDAFAALAPLANRLPAALSAAALGHAPAADLLVTTLPGPGRATYVAGARIDAMYVFGPLPGTAVTATLVSFRDTACIGLNVDGSAVEDTALLRGCVADALAALL